MIAKLGSGGLTPALEEKLFAYYEACGRYDRAEDMLFHRRESLDDAAWRRLALAFYDKLQALPDDALERGGLPREEIALALQDIGRETV